MLKSSAVSLTHSFTFVDGPWLEYSQHCFAEKNQPVYCIPELWSHEKCLKKTVKIACHCLVDKTNKPYNGKQIKIRHSWYTYMLLLPVETVYRRRSNIKCFPVKPKAKLNRRIVQTCFRLCWCMAVTWGIWWVWRARTTLEQVADTVSKYILCAFLTVNKENVIKVELRLISQSH